MGHRLVKDPSAAPPALTIRAEQTVEFHCKQCGATNTRIVPEEQQDYKELYEFAIHRLYAFETRMCDLIAIYERGDIERAFFLERMERLRDEGMIE